MNGQVEKWEDEAEFGRKKEWETQRYLIALLQQFIPYLSALSST